MPSVRLLQFTDMHLFGDGAACLRGVASLPALQAALADARRRCPRPDGILLTGDLVQDDPQGYRWIREIFADSPVPVLCLAGNHDLPGPMRTTLAQAPFQLGGHQAFGRWRVVMLDSQVSHRASGRLGEEQLETLDSLLRTHGADHVLLCLHHHPIRMHSNWLDQVGLSDADEFLALVRRHANIRGVLWGHVHQSLDHFIGGVRFMASPSTCAQFLPGSPDFSIDDRPPGYRLLELMPDGTIATEVCWLEDAARSNAA